MSEVVIRVQPSDAVDGFSFDPDRCVLQISSGPSQQAQRLLAEQALRVLIRYDDDLSIRGDRDYLDRLFEG